jgi:O-methyltransferase involved in polyketide biosynthesis
VSTRAKGVLVLTEGVIPYLTNDDVADLADELRKMDKLRFWIVDYFSPEALRFGRKMRTRFMRNAPFRFEPKDWFDFFGRHGWQAEEIRYIADEAERLKRPIPLPPLLKAWVILRGVFASPARRQAMKRYAAYVLLIPK